MGLESATYINGLVASNPTSSDNANQGDNHIRLIKSAVKATFPNITGAVTVTQAELNSVTGKLDLAGGTMTGALTVLTPTATGHAATKGYVDALATAVAGDVSTINTALANRVRVDTNAQGLTGPQQLNARTNIGLATSDGLTEGTSNLYFTNARARSAISATGDISYNATTGVISFTAGAAPVTSVAGKTGAVTLVIADVSGLQTALDGKASASHSHAYLSTSGGSLSGSLSVTGSITATGDITAYSDIRVKENVETITEALHKVRQLRGVSYVSKIDHEPKIGVIAQEVERIIPEVVKTHSDGIKSVAYQNLVGLLIEAIKDLEERVAELENR